MQISKHRYGKVIDALDGIRADNREGKYGEESRHIDDDILLFIERNGYCKYIVESARFIRVLTDAGLEVLSFQDYSKYLRKKRFRKLNKSLPLIVSIIAVTFTGLSMLNKPNPKNTEIENRLKRLEKLQDSEYIHQLHLDKKNIQSKVLDSTNKSS